MPDYTPNYNLPLPRQEEYYAIDIVNQITTTIDKQLKVNADSIALNSTKINEAQQQLNALGNYDDSVLLAAIQDVNVKVETVMATSEGAQEGLIELDDKVNQRFIELTTVITGEITLTVDGWDAVDADTTTYPKHAGWYQQRWPAEDDDERIWQGQSPDAMPDPRDVAAAGKAGAMQVAAHDGYATFFASKKPLADIRIETLRLIDTMGVE